MERIYDLEERMVRFVGSRFSFVELSKWIMKETITNIN